MASSTSDIEAAQRFLGVLASGEPVTFQTFDEGPKRRSRLSRVLHGSISEHAATLSALNNAGAGVFWMVNAGDLRGRKATNVRRVRALFVDLDGATLEPVLAGPLAPRAIVETSPGRWHAYWPIAGCPLTEFTSLQHALALRFAGDEKVSDLPRVMRLPGFAHRKGIPFTVQVVSITKAAPYTLAEFKAAFGINATTRTMEWRPGTSRQLPARIPQGERNTTLFDFACSLVRKGFSLTVLNQRLQQINAKRCHPPLRAVEVDDIAARAHGYGSDGFAILSHRLLDSPQWKALGPPAHDIILTALRRYDGTNNGNIALTWEDFKEQPGFANRHTFYRHRRDAVQSGILVLKSQGRNSQTGRKPDLYGIAPQFLHESSPGSKLKPGPNVEKVHSYVDEQSSSESTSAQKCAQPEKAA